MKPRFCATAGCPVVYYDERGRSDLFDLSDVRVNVGCKRAATPATLCYCFGYSEERIRGEFARTDSSSASRVIRERVAAGECACEMENPAGVCCLGAVTSFEKKLLHDDAVGTPRRPATGWAQFSALAIGLLASACCWLPLLLLVAGLGGAGAAAAIEPLRPWLLGFAALLLGFAWWTRRRTLRQEAADSGCCDREDVDSPPRRAWSHSLFWPAVLLTIGLAFLPPVLGAILTGQGEAEATTSTSSLLELGSAHSDRDGSVAELLRSRAEVQEVAILRGGAAIRVDWNRATVDIARVEAALAAADVPGRLVELEPARLEVEGMTCAACANHVSRALLDTPGVGAVAADYDAKAFEIRVVGDSETMAAAFAAIAAAGYEATLATREPVGSVELAELGCCTEANLVP